MRRNIFLAFVFGWLLIYNACNKKQLIETKAQETAIYYLYHPALISDTFSRIMWHHAIDFRGLDSEEKQLYFIAKKEYPKTEMLKVLTLDSTQIEYAPCDTGMCIFGGMEGIIDGYYAFRIPTTNLKVDTTKMFTYKYFDSKMTVSFSDLMNEQNDKIFYNTSKSFDLSRFYGEKVYASNIGAYISLKEKDKVIKQLTEKLTAGLKTNEEKAQALLRFVTNNIEYSYEDLWYQTEIVKHAHEVLVNGEADCSGKTTLYASMLEQCDIPYCLLYFQNHINVGIAGKFPNDNGYAKTVDNTKYAMAETTVEDFIIGKTKIDNAEILTDLMCYQNPRKSPNIYNAKTRQALEFVKVDEEE